MDDRAAIEVDPLVRVMLTICVMMATVMQALDTTIANVALPYMQGALSTTLDQVNWVLTSYIVAAAIMTSPIGWLSARFGRKKLFITCAAGFTVASMLCGAAQSIDQMVLFRLLQGVFGAALVPLSQTVMLDIYPPSRRGSAMAIWGMGVMLGPIMGPTLGGWLTDNYSWRWVFFVNLPFGVLTVLGLSAFMSESKTNRQVPFAWFGFLTLSLGIGALQMMLDRGEDQGWFGSTEIIIEAVLAAVGFYFFIADSITSRRPFIPLGVFADWNFAIALIFMFLIGVILLATMALVTPYLQNLMGYPVLASGMLLGSRGLGTFFSMTVVGRLLAKIDARRLIFFGLLLSTISLWYMVYWSPQSSAESIALISIMQGVGLGFVFVPLNTLAFATLPAQLRTDATAMWTLIRNLGSSIGISIVIARLTSMITTFHSQLAEQISPFNDALHAPGVANILSTKTDSGRAMLDGLLTQQAAIMAYSNDFLLMTFVSLAAFPLLFMMRSSKAAANRPPSGRDGHAAVMD
ncbi:MAG TPA: DHA2 family efflux MFS transporter permease subunit [Roseiarcus sp.]|nr:DHA2 family efflux MFS transporter permease subunit [Roseiarcus sp.]